MYALPTTILTIFIVIAAVLLILFVLVQNSKGGGLASSFSSSNQIMGVRKTTDVLEKATWGLISFVLILSVLAVGLHKNSTKGNENDSLVKEQYQNAAQEAQGATLPEFGEPAEEPAE